MNCGNNAAKNTTALGLAAEVKKPCSQSVFSDARETVSGDCSAVGRALHIIREPSQIRYKTPSHLIIVSTFADKARTAARPRPAASICSALAVRSPKAVAADRANPCLALFDSINSWLGPGVIMSAKTVATNANQVSKGISLSSFTSSRSKIAKLSPSLYRH